MERIKVVDRILYQWNSGRKIRIEPTAGETVDFVHYNNGNAVEVVKDGNSVIAPIPNILLQTAQNITAYAVIVCGDGTRTVCDCTFPVRAKPKPDDYVYEETEVLTITTAVEKALQNAKESGEFDGDDGTSPVVSVSDITGGHRISITDKNGTQSFDVMDGKSVTAGDVSAEIVGGILVVAEVKE